MPFRITISSKNQKHSHPVYRSQSDVLVIGRDKTKRDEEANYLYLHDEQRMLSRHHTMIEYRNNTYRIKDLSENGTVLDGKPLKRGQWYPLSDSNEIRVGNYFLLFTRDGTGDISSDSGFNRNLIDKVKDTIAALTQAYEKNSHNKNGESDTKRALQEIVIRHFENLEDEEALEAFVLLDKYLAEGDVEWRYLVSPAFFKDRLLTHPQKRQMYEAAYQAAIKLKYRFSEKNPPFRSPEELQAFFGQIERIISVLSQGMLELTMGRQTYVKDKAPGMSQILQKRYNPVKSFKTVPEFAEYIFDCSDPENTANLIANLEEALHELKVHQIAIMAAFEEALTQAHKELMLNLDPDSIKKQTKNDFPFLFGPFLHLACWHRLRRNYRKQNEMSLNQWITRIEDILINSYHQINKQDSTDADSMSAVSQ